MTYLSVAEMREQLMIAQRNRQSLMVTVSKVKDE